MARRIVVASLTYSSATNRNSALTRINSALSGYTYVDFDTSLPPGINTSGTTGITISIDVEDRDTAFDLAKAIYDASVQSNRHTSGYLSVNRI
jgi:hypothetical protein